MVPCTACLTCSMSPVDSHAIFSSASLPPSFTFAAELNNDLLPAYVFSAAMHLYHFLLFTLIEPELVTYPYFTCTRWMRHEFREQRVTGTFGELLNPAAGQETVFHAIGCISSTLESMLPN